MTLRLEPVAKKFNMASLSPYSCTCFQSLSLIGEASDQVKNSRLFARILKIVLAMGNELDKANNRPVASAFRVTFLSQVINLVSETPSKII